MKNLIFFLTGINRVLLILTLTLYFTFYLGLISQLILGAFQIISFLILVLNIKRFEKRIVVLLKVYTLLVSLFFLGMYLFSELSITVSKFISLSGIILIPMVIAFYFTYILENVSKSNNLNK